MALSRRYVLSSTALWLAPLDAVRLDLECGELREIDLGQREPGGSVGISSNASLPLSLAVTIWLWVEPGFSVFNGSLLGQAASA